VNPLECVCPMVGQQQMKREKGDINTKSPKLTVIVHLRQLLVLLTQGRYYRGSGKNLPVNPYRYYRPRAGTTDTLWNCKEREHKCTCWLGVPHTNLGQLSKHFYHLKAVNSHPSL
jgi:hypothetical protein